MGRIVQPGYSRYDGNSGRSSGNLKTFFASFVRLVREYGFRGVVALVVAALLAFAPAALLVWFNVARLSSVVQLQPGQTVIVKPARHSDDQEKDEAGETSLLVVKCDVTWVGDPRPLLVDDDPVRRDRTLGDSVYVRREQVYIRPAYADVPFGLLGPPPVSVWLPPGEYDVLVVHEAPNSESRIDAVSPGFPYVSTRATCSLENRSKTECRVPLPHYDGSNFEPLPLVNADGTTAARKPTADELRPIVEACEVATAVPTPGGYLLTLPEPFVRHTDDHRGCAEDFSQRISVTREWTRDQLATLRRWLPDDATAARARLMNLIGALQWREFFAGWYCYAAAGVAGVVFTRWGATAILEPWQRRRTFGEAVKLTFSIFLISAVLWILVQMFFG